MKRDYLRDWSPALGRQMEMLVFGHAGTPVVVFPTSMGRFHEWEDFGMVRVLERQLEEGQNILFCVDSIDRETFYDKGGWPGDRLARHAAWERHIVDEVVPLAKRWAANDYVIAAGASFGAYHAANLALKHPWHFRKLIAMGGSYDIRELFFGDSWEPQVYDNNPVEYMANLSDPHYLGWLASNDLRLLTGEWDFCWGPTERLARVLGSKGLQPRYECWGHGTGHDWPHWFEMIRRHIG